MIVPVVVIAVTGYAWPFDSLEFHETWEIRCLLISFVGLAIRMLAAGQLLDASSGRTSQHRATCLDTDGVFSIVRHPRYLGDYWIGLGVVLIPFVWWLPIVYSVAFYFYYKRLVMIDERSLRRQFAEKFVQWASVTRAFIPRLSNWRPARGPYSFRTALKREHTTLFLVIALHSSVEWLEHLILERRIMLEVFWAVLTLAGLTAYVLVRHLTKHTRLLNVPAR
ncbi:MAG: isoprenylcysteine carboxylmethyltransferase family protein [Planctomycetes bacterium]|nr:isoprenylcysteine carboxylmethyltransferase family protein [Planctomycetota bacterium]